jgi:hypothetical protein
MMGIVITRLFVVLKGDVEQYIAAVNAHFLKSKCSPIEQGSCQ